MLARDKKTGESGEGVQPHYFQLTPAVPWALAGVGAVATQSRVNVSYGPLGLELLQAGLAAPPAVEARAPGAPLAGGRQAPILHPPRRRAPHPRAQSIPAPGHPVRDGFHF